MEYLVLLCLLTVAWASTVRYRKCRTLSIFRVTHLRTSSIMTQIFRAFITENLLPYMFVELPRSGYPESYRQSPNKMHDLKVPLLLELDVFVC